MTTLTPDLVAAGLAANRVHRHHAERAGLHLAFVHATTNPRLADASRDLAAEHAAEAGAARLESQDLFRLAQAGGVQ